MQDLSGYEIAQKRIETRQQKRRLIGFWIAMLILLAVFTLLAGVVVMGCTIPLTVMVGFFAIMDGIQLYYASPRRAPSRAMVDDQMLWLFGDDWPGYAGTQEYMLAQERIRRRRISRGYFYLHLTVYLLVNAALLYLVIDSFTRPYQGALGCMVLFPFLWLAFLTGHGVMVFPSRQRLARRERQIGQAIQAEIQRLEPERAKRKEKPKRDVQYAVGEDGELVEISDHLDTRNDEKPKGDMLL